MMIHNYAKFAPLDFINKNMMRKRRVFLPKPNIPFHENPTKTLPERTIGPSLKLLILLDFDNLSNALTYYSL